MTILSIDIIPNAKEMITLFVVVIVLLLLLRVVSYIIKKIEGVKYEVQRKLTDYIGKNGTRRIN